MSEICVVNKQWFPTSSSSSSEDSSNDDSPRPTRGNSNPVTPRSNMKISGPLRRAKGGWTAEEDEMLRAAVKIYKGRCWKKIAEYFSDRSEVQCLHRWQKVLDPELNKGPWSQEEDETIIQLVEEYGPMKWSRIAEFLPGRIGKQCRERWHNHLNPDIKKDAWTMDEELILMNAHTVYGNGWAEIAKIIPGRTDNAIKNHWNSSLKKRLDHFLATGRLPSDPVMSPPHSAKGIKKAVSTGKSIAYSLLSKRVEVDKDGLEEFSNPSQDTDTSSSSLSSESDDSEDVMCKSQSSHSDHSRQNLVPNFKSSSINGQINVEEVIDLTSDVEIPNCSSLYNEPRAIDSSMPSDSDRLRIYCPTNMASQCYVNPPCIKNYGNLDGQTPESILKIAARSFPNTPSILRKRKREGHSSPSLHRARRTEEEPVEGLTDKGVQMKHGREKSTSSVKNSHSNCGSALPDGNSFIASPPYRIRSKRTSVYKSMEKLLEFTQLERQQCDDITESGDLVVKKNRPVTKTVACPRLR